MVCFAKLCYNDFNRTLDTQLTANGGPNMNETYEKILSRRSIKQYKSDPVPAELIEQIVTAGTYAASGMNKQSPIIVAVTDKAIVEKLSKANAAVMGADIDPFYNAPAVLVVLGDKSIGTRVYDGSLVMGNMLLAAHSLGLGSCWIHRAKEVFDMPEWKEWLKSVGVEGEYEGIAHCVVGYPAIDYPAASERRPGRTYFVK